MAWPRIKNSRSSALPGTHKHSAVQVNVTPAPDADPASREAKRRGQRHSTLRSRSPGGRRFPALRPRHADRGTDAGEPPAETEETTAFGYDDDEPLDSGIAILGGIPTTEVPGDAPTAPQPAGK